MFISKIRAERHYVFDPSAHIIMNVFISGKPSITELKRAIIVAVNNQNILNCRILMDSEGDTYYVPREVDFIPQIDVYDRKRDTEIIVNEQCKKEFDIQNGELVRFIIMQYDNETELVVVQHHLGGDGKSMLFLIENIMENLEHPVYSTNRKFDRSVKVYDEKYASKYVKMNELIEETIEGMNEKWRKENKVFRLDERTEVFKEFWKDKDVEVNSFELNRDELNNLLGQCKEHGVTLNSVIATVIYKSQLEPIKVGIIADIRDKGDKSMGNYAEPFMTEELYDYSKEFWENVEYVDKMVKSKLVDRKQLLLGTLIRCTAENGLHHGSHFSNCKYKVVDDYNDSFFVRKEGLPLLLSNLGVAPIRNEYGCYAIEKIKFMSPLAVRTYSNVAVVTINNTLVLSMLNFKGDKRFEGFFDRIKIEIDELLGVKQTNEQCEYLVV